MVDKDKFMSGLIDRLRSSNLLWAGGFFQDICNDEAPGFWMVKGSGPPLVRHCTEGDAKHEAERLANANPGQEFTILKATDTVCREINPEVTWKKNDAPGVDCIPF